MQQGSELVRNKAAGFTLMEIVISTCIIVMLCVGLRVILQKAHHASETIDVRTEQFQKLRGCVDTLSRELPTAFIAGSDPSLCFVGTPHAITFTAASNIPRQKGEYDIKRISYTLANGALVRRTRRVPELSDSSASSMVPATSIATVRFAYHDGASWTATWDSAAATPPHATLPRAISIYLAVEAKQEPPLTMTTVVAIPTA